MFPSTPKNKLAQRALGALRVARSFLLLEDDYEVDWEVGQDERTAVPHPHRAPLRGGWRGRGGGPPGRGAGGGPRPQACLSPVGRDLYASHAARERRAENKARSAANADACSNTRSFR
jgi:hypothetical protein